MFYGGDYGGDCVGERSDTRSNTSKSHRHRKDHSHTKSHSSSAQATQDKEYALYNERPPSVASSNDGSDPYSRAPNFSIYGPRQDSSSQRSYRTGYGVPASYPPTSYRVPAPQLTTSSHAPPPYPIPYTPYGAPSPYANHPAAYASSSYTRPQAKTSYGTASYTYRP